MRLRHINSFFRQTHKWVSLIVALYFIFKLVTGIFLQVRKPVDWIQPPTQHGVGYKTYQPTITHAQILNAARSVPEANITDWSDILLLDLRMKNGIVKVRTYDWYEIQIDTLTGDILSHSQRWNDRIGRWHSGSQFGSIGLVVFFILSVLTLFLVVSGTWLAGVTTLNKWKRYRLARRTVGKAVHTPKKKFNIFRFSFEYHYYIGLIVCVPYIMVSVSGIMLQWRDLTGQYPTPLGGSLATVTGSAKIPTLDYSAAIRIAMNHEPFNISKPNHIWRIYTYPNDGVLALRTKRYVGTRLQLDAQTGQVLAVGPFSSDFWEDVHQGHFYQVTGDPGKKGYDYRLTLNLYLVIHGLAFILWLTGVCLFFKRRQN